VRIGKIPDQVIRLSIIFILLISALIIARYKFVPKSFGKMGHYRADSITEIANLPIKYAGAFACFECHSDIAEIKNNSYHRGLSCEVCHGPASAHAKAPDEVKPIIPRNREHCAKCHDYNPSRPTGFPQIYLASHNPNKPCITCHNPHDPKPPNIPKTCSACHTNIARTKAVSYHASLECETCHETPPEHNENPRAYLPKKPIERKFCGQCHSKDATLSKEAPRVDMDSHGDRYLCWQCHYPHLPEAK
jgi:Cytochrome c7 and related cytochrome c/Cytochrome c554 and c-prime